MYIRIQISPENTTISERRSDSECWKVVLTGDSNNLTMMSRRLIDSPKMVIREYFTQDNFGETEEYIFEDYEPIHDEPKIFGISQYGLAKLAAC